MNQAEQLATLERDAARRALRESDALVALAQAYYNVPDNYHLSRNITGEPSDKNRTHRASDDCWGRGLKGRTIGIAPGHVTPFASVLVTKDGVTTVVSANSFRKPHIATKQKKHNDERIDRENKARHITTAADLAPIGNVE